MVYKHILSLVPSITLLLFDLGLEKNIAGRTKFCIHPSEPVKKIPAIGGTKTIDIEKIRVLRPDLVIANKEENEKKQIEALQKEFNVLLTDVSTLEENYSMIEEIGKLSGTENKATEIIQTTRQNFEELRTFTKSLSLSPSLSLYLIWRKPWMTIGRDTFIHSMMETIGLKNAFADQIRYPVINDLRELPGKNCELILLSSEPYPFAEKHILEIQKQLPDAKILLVDGEYFSWYGSKIMGAPAYFRQLLTRIHEQ